MRKPVHLPLRIVGARPRLFSSAGLGALAFAATPQSWGLVSRSLVGWNIALVCYLLLAGWMMLRSTPESIRRRADAQDEGRFFILLLSTVAATASIGAIVAQLATVKELAGAAKALHIGLSATTILTSWLFIHLMFALHYAHEFFFEIRVNPDKPGKQRGGLVCGPAAEEVTCRASSENSAGAFVPGSAGWASCMAVNSYFYPVRFADYFLKIL